MGVAAYNRGSRCISREFRREACPVVTPRPSTWGCKVEEKALAKARGLLSYLAARGHPQPCENDLADMVRQDTKWGAAACQSAALAAIEEIRHGTRSVVNQKDLKL